MINDPPPPTTWSVINIEKMSACEWPVAIPEVGVLGRRFIPSEFALSGIIGSEKEASLVVAHLSHKAAQGAWHDSERLAFVTLTDQPQLPDRWWRCPDSIELLAWSGRSNLKMLSMPLSVSRRFAVALDSFKSLRVKRKLTMV
jgi:hypothetical protein